MAGEPSGSALGFGAFHDSGDDDGGDPGQLEAMLEDDQAPAPAPVVEDLPEIVEEHDDYPAVAETEEEPPGEPGEGDPAIDETPQQQYAGRYQTVEELENGYKEIQGGFTRMAQENRQFVQNQQIQETRLAELEALNQQMIEVLQAQMFENDPEAAEQFQREMQQRQAIDQQVQQQVQQAVGPIQQQAVQQQVDQAAERSVMEFYQRRQIEQGSQEDIQATTAFRQLRSMGVPLDITNPDHIEAAYDAAQDPAFLNELIFNPQALQIPDGVARLRQRAGGTIPAVAGAAPLGTPAPAQRQAVRRRVEAHVETGSSGAPGGSAPGTKPADIDPFDEAMDYYKGQRSRGVLFGSQRT